jgi:transposase
MHRYELTDFEWERIEKYFPEKLPGIRGRPPKSARTKLNGILWIARSGAPWRDLPERYGPREPVYDFFCELTADGLFIRIFNDLNVDSDLQDISLDSASVRVHQHAAGAKKGANHRK